MAGSSAGRKRKLRSPYFVRATVMKNGWVELIDDEGEEFCVEMRRDQAWPLESRTPV